MKGDSEVKLVSSAGFQRVLLRTAIESTERAFKVVSLRMRGSERLFLHELVGLDEEARLPAGGPSEARGVLVMEEAALAGALARFASPEFVLFFNFDDETLALLPPAQGAVIEVREWQRDACLLHTFAFAPASLADLRASLALVALPGLEPLQAKASEGGVALAPPPAPVWAKHVELIQAGTRRDDATLLSEFPVLSLRQKFASGPRGSQSEVGASPKDAPRMVEFFGFALLPDLAQDFSQVTAFLNEFYRLEPGPQQARLARYSPKDKFLVAEEASRESKLGCKHFFRHALRADLHASKLRNVHLPLLAQAGRPKLAARPNMVYFHYNQDGEFDDGWGCAYRSLQTLASFILLNSNLEGYVPSIRRIQELLVEMGDKKESFVGSREWIGSFEVSFVLKKIFNVESNMLHIPSGAAILENLAALKTHLKVFGTPIMFGGGAYAYTLLAIAEDDEEPENSLFLILDPHYKGADELRLVTNPKSKAIYWATAKHFKAQSFYNFCCPHL